MPHILYSAASEFAVSALWWPVSRNGSISNAHSGSIPQSRPPSANPPSPSKREPNEVYSSAATSAYFTVTPSRITETMSEPPICSIYRFTMTSQYFSSSSMVKQILPLCSQAMSVEPLPPKQKRNSPSRHSTSRCVLSECDSMYDKHRLGGSDRYERRNHEPEYQLPHARTGARNHVDVCRTTSAAKDEP